MTPYLLRPNEVEYLRALLADAAGSQVRVAWDDGLKVKVSNGTWTLNLGTAEDRSQGWQARALVRGTEIY